VTAKDVTYRKPNPEGYLAADDFMVPLDVVDDGVPSKKEDVMKPVWLLRTLVVLLILVAAGALSRGALTAPGPVKIGVLTPLSPPGDYAAGQLIVRGAKLGAEYVNAKGGVRSGRKVDLVIVDDSGTPEKGVAGFRKLATQDGVIAIMGQFHSSVMNAVNDQAEPFGIPVFSTQASAKMLTAKHLLTTFRTHVIDPDRAKLFLNLIKDKGYKRIVLLAENTDYGIGMIEDTKEQKEHAKAEIELKSILFDRQVVDLTPQLLEIKAWKPDLVINIGVGTPTYLIIKQAHDIGLFPATPMLVSYDLPIRPEFWDNLGDTGNYLIYIVYYHPKMALTEAGKWFQERYTQEYKEPPVYSAFNGFGQIVIIAEALNTAASDKPTDLIKALEAGKFTSWNGVVTFERGEGPYWHQWSPPMLVLQYTKARQPWEEATILYPPEMKTGEYTAPQ
jgi:branched-chain amino acid transport system substrate-binding protein